MDSITLPQNLFTLQDLMSLGGLVVAVYVIVSFFKEKLKTRWGDWVVRPFSVAVALVIMLWLVFIQGAATPETIGLAIINAFLVALVAGAAHDYIVAPTKEKAAQGIGTIVNTTDIISQTENTNSAAETASAVETSYRGSSEEPPSTT